MKRDIILFIENIMENIVLIENSVEKISKMSFESDRLIIDATVRRLEIVGEAAKNIPKEFRDKYSGIPWKKMAGIRDVLTHAYFSVNIERIWNIIKKDLPKLKIEIKKILEKEK